MTAASLLMYNLEHAAQPDIFQQMLSLLLVASSSY